MISIASTNWLSFLFSAAGLPARLAIGGGIFLVLAAHDLIHNGRQARRWREYLFLIVTAAVFMAYGAINDSITSRISWEYFYYGKGLSDVLGPRTPPDPAALRREAAKIGITASWSGGLIAGAALLIANNPRKTRTQLPFWKLLSLLPIILLCMASAGVLFGFAGRAGLLTWISSDFRLLVHDNLFRPREFLTVFGIHLGAYIGGLFGAGWTVRKIVVERSQRVKRG